MIKKTNDGPAAPLDATARNNTVSALFREAKQAGLAFDTAIDLGHDPHEIQVLMARFIPDELSPDSGNEDGLGRGGLTVGVLLNSGISKDRATVYKAAIDQGGIVLAVRPRNELEASELVEIWEDLGAEETHWAC